LPDDADGEHANGDRDGDGCAFQLAHRGMLTRDVEGGARNTQTRPFAVPLRADGSLR
jgi:hypothetical protein